MKTWVRRTARVGILSAGFLLVAGTAAAANASPLDMGPAHSAATQADAANSGQVSSDNKGLVNGTQVSIPIQVPVNACGNGVGVIGVGVGVSGNCDNGALLGSGASTEAAHTTEDADAANDGQVSAGNQGILNGTQVSAPIQVPVNLCGNGVGVIGVGIGVSGNCDNGAVKGSGAHAESAHATEDADLAQGAGGQTSAGNDGILNGTQVYAPIQVPVNVCGNGVGVIGVGLGVSGNCDDGALIGSDTSAGDSHDGGDRDYRDGGDRTNAVKPAAVKPAKATKATKAPKAAKATKATKAHKESATESDMWDQGGDDMSGLDAANDGQVSQGNQGILNGTQVSAPIQVPVNVCGNGVGVIGVGIGVSGNCDNGAANVSGASTGDDHHSDRSDRRNH